MNNLKKIILKRYLIFQIRTGEVSGKRCLKMSDSDEWKDSFICTGEETPYNFFWSDEEKSDCLKIKEPHDWGWKTKYLCTTNTRQIPGRWSQMVDGNNTFKDGHKNLRFHMFRPLKNY